MVADSVSAALAECAEELGSWRKTLLRACTQWLAVSFSGREPEDEDTRAQEKAMLLRLSELLVSLSLRGHKPDMPDLRDACLAVV